MNLTEIIVNKKTNTNYLCTSLHVYNSLKGKKLTTEISYFKVYTSNHDCCTPSLTYNNIALTIMSTIMDKIWYCDLTVFPISREVAPWKRKCKS